MSPLINKFREDWAAAAAAVPLSVDWEAYRRAAERMKKDSWLTLFTARESTPDFDRSRDWYGFLFETAMPIGDHSIRSVIAIRACRLFLSPEDQRRLQTSEMEWIYDVATTIELALMAYGISEDQVRRSAFREGRPTRPHQFPATAPLDSATLLYVAFEYLRKILNSQKTTTTAFGGRPLDPKAIRDALSELCRAVNMTIACEATGVGRDLTWKNKNSDQATKNKSGRRPKIKVDSDSLARYEEIYLVERATNHMKAAFALGHQLAGIRREDMDPKFYECILTTLGDFARLHLLKEDMEGALADVMRGGHGLASILANLNVADDPQLRQMSLGEGGEADRRDAKTIEAHRAELATFIQDPAAKCDPARLRRLRELLEEMGVRRGMRSVALKTANRFLGSLSTAIRNYNLDGLLFWELLEGQGKVPMELPLPIRKTITEKEIAQDAEYLARYMDQFCWAASMKS